MKVALVYPEAVDLARYKEGRKEFPPFGALYLASAIESFGYDVEVIKITENQFTFDFTVYDAICFSISSSATFDLFKMCRESSIISRTDQLLLAGGVHAHFFPEQTLVDLDVHAVCYAEGEQIIFDLLNSNKPRVDLGKIPNLVFVDDFGNICKTHQLKIEKYLNKMPLPARHLFPEEDIVMSDRLGHTDTRMAHVMFTKGCPFSCEYCAVAQTKMQYRSGCDCAKELEHLVDHYKIGGFAIVDDNFIISRKVVFDICKKIEPLNLKWSALSRVDVVKPDLLGAMKKSGCHEIKYGVESGDEGLLSYMKKNTTIDQIETALRETANAGIESKVFIVHGFPGENLMTTNKTIDLLRRNRHLISRVSIFRFVPLPGTGSFNEWKKYGIRGTHFENGWDGKWSNFHIHHNDRHWWGGTEDFSELHIAHQRLETYVSEAWPSRFENY